MKLESDLKIYCVYTPIMVFNNGCQAFYNGVTQPVRSIIDAAAGGTLLNKTEYEAYNLIKEMTLNNFQWSTERRQPKQVGGKLKVDALTLLSAKVDAMTQKLD